MTTVLLFAFLYTDPKWQSCRPPIHTQSQQDEVILSRSGLFIGTKYYTNSMHTSSVERFSENFLDKAVTYTIFFIGTHWFRKCNFWKNSLGPFWGRRGRQGQTTLKLKTTKILNENSLKIDEIQNLASGTSKMASWPRGPRKGLSDFFTVWECSVHSCSCP